MSVNPDPFKTDISIDPDLKEIAEKVRSKLFASNKTSIKPYMESAIHTGGFNKIEKVYHSPSGETKEHGGYNSVEFVFLIDENLDTHVMEDKLRILSNFLLNLYGRQGINLTFDVTPRNKSYTKDVIYVIRCIITDKTRVILPPSIVSSIRTIFKKIYEYFVPKKNIT